jgi:hypothetical protein
MFFCKFSEWPEIGNGYSKMASNYYKDFLKKENQEKLWKST